MRLFLALSFLCFSTFAVGQKSAYKWLEAGLKVQYGGTHLLNSTIIDNPDRDYNITTGYAIGARFGANIGKNGISLEAMFANSEAGYEFIPGDATVSWSSLDAYLMYRNNANLGYFEIGPKFSFINGVDRQIGSEDASSIVDAAKSPNMGIAFGFGAYVLGDEGTFTGLLGLRFEYGFSDFFGDDDPNATTGLLAPRFTEEGDPTNPLFAGIVFELNWGIGYWAKAGCGQRAKMVRF